MKIKKIKMNDWMSSGTKRFGQDMRYWKFKCASCGETQTLKEFQDAGIKGAKNMFYYSCIGRHLEDRGCQWTLGGLVKIHKTEVVSEDGEKVPVFEFAD